MSKSLPCPNCGDPIVEENFKEYSNPFTMKCPHCHAKIKETKVTPWLLILTVALVPFFIFIGISLQNQISEFWPFIEKIPTIFVFLAFAYPIYAAYESFNARILVSKGHLKLKN